jgi:CRISPR-associated exonuclease Cas4
MHKNENKFIRVSDISSFLFCPKKFYYRYRRHDDKVTVGEIRSCIYKMISCAIHDVLSRQDPYLSLEQAIKGSCEEALIIYGMPFEDYIRQIEENILRNKKPIIDGIDEYSKRSGIGLLQLQNMLKPVDESLMLFSERLHLSGTIDRTILWKNMLIPSITSVSSPPKNGVYVSDKIRLAAYSMLLSEKYGMDIRMGAIEYFPRWSFNLIEIRHSDIRAVLSARNRIRKIMEGQMPDGKRGEKCKNCEYANSCNVKVSFLDSLLG